MLQYVDSFYLVISPWYTWSLVYYVLAVGGIFFPSRSFIIRRGREREEAISWRKLLSSVLPMFKHLLLPLTVHIGELWFWFVIFVHSGIENGMCAIVQCTIRPRGAPLPLLLLSLFYICQERVLFVSV